MNIDNDVLFALGCMALILGFFMVIFMGLEVIGNWKMFKKAGEKGWKAIVPFLNEYTCFELYWKKEMFFPFIALLVLGGLTSSENELISALGTLSSIGTLVLSFKLADGMAKCHGKGMGMTFFMLFFPGLASLVLGFGKSEYKKVEL